MKYCSSCKEKFDDSLSFCPADGEVLEEDPSALTGKVLDGQYQIEALLGKGGMVAPLSTRGTGGPPLSPSQRRDSLRSAHFSRWDDLPRHGICRRQHPRRGN